MLTLADLAPADGGVKVTEIVQVPLGAIAEPQVLSCEKAGTLAPIRLTVLMLKAAVPVLVTVMTWAVLATPTAWVPKAMLVVLSDSAGAPLTPVPVSGTAVGLLLALLTMLTLADLAPAPAGPNVTEIVQVPLGAMAEPQVLVVEKEGTLAPPRLTELMFSAEPPVLVTVIRCAGLEVPVA